MSVELFGLPDRGSGQPMHDSKQLDWQVGVFRGASAVHTRAAEPLLTRVESHHASIGLLTATCSLRPVADIDDCSLSDGSDFEAPSRCHVYANVRLHPEVLPSRVCLRCAPNPI